MKPRSLRVSAVALLSSLALAAASVQAQGTQSTGPRDVALLDADGDGDLDVATADEGSHDLSLRRNDGAGALGVASAVALGTSLGPTALAAGDLDNDGARDDLAVACTGSHTIAIVVDPNAATPVLTTIAAGGLRPVDVATGDLDAGAIDDVLVACEGEPLAGGSGLYRILDNGAASAVTIPAGNATRCVKVAIGDLDGDGDRDAAVLAQGGSDQLLLFAGDGSGSLTFAGAVGLPTAGLASGLCCADLDGDGDRDLAVVLPQLFPTPSQTLRILRYTGSGVLDAGDYTATSDLPLAGTLAVDLACGDLEDDSIPGFLSRVDVAIASAGTGTVGVQHGFTGSAFTSSSSPTAGTNPIAVAIGDLNADGGDDLVVANQGSNDVSVILTTQPALAQVFGTGCAGTGGLVPAISAVGLPTSGNPAFGVSLSNARASAPALLLFSAGVTSTPLTGGCTLYLAVPIASILRFTSGSGQATFTFGVPSTPALRGGDAFFQWAVFDPSGAFGGILALSDALRLQVGS